MAFRVRYEWEPLLGRASETLESLAERFGVVSSSIQRVVYGQTWRHVGGPIGRRGEVA